MAERPAVSCDEFVDLATAVALDAVDERESKRLEEHVATCPECERKLREFREVAAALGSAVSQVEPPAELRERVLKAVRQTQQPGPARGVRRLWPASLPRRRLSAAWLITAASLVVSLGALSGVAVLQSQINELQREAQVARERAVRYDRVVAVLASEQLTIRPLIPVVKSTPSAGMAYLDPSSGSGMLMCHNLPPVEQGRAYQVWFVRGSERMSGGLLWPDRGGNGYALIRVPSDLRSYDSIGLTDEPGTGSQSPTTPRVIGTPLKDSQ